MTTRSQTMTSLSVTAEPYGDSAIMVSSLASDPAERRQDAIAFRRSLFLRQPPGLTDVVAGLESLLVEFDPARTSSDDMLYAVRLLAERPVADVDASDGLSFEIPLVIDEQTAPDLDEVAAELDVTPTEFIETITSSEFTIALLAAAMAPMMDGLRVTRPVRRRANPRTDVPAGSIMVAGTNAIIQPFPGPTGWRVVGRTPHTIVDIHREMPTSFSPGDRVRFRLVTVEEARALSGTFLEPSRAGAPW